MLATRKQDRRSTYATSSQGLNGSSHGGNTLSTVQPSVSYQRRVVQYGDDRPHGQSFIGLEKIKQDDTPFTVTQNYSHDGSIKTNDNEV